MPEAASLAAPPPVEAPAMPAHARLSAPPWFGVARFGPKALVRISGEIGLTGQTAAELLAAIGDAAEIQISIDSPGGDSAAALEIYDALAGRNVEIEIAGTCFSAAVTIALTGRRITMRRDALLMLHAAQIFAFGSSEHLEMRARGLRKLNSRLREIITQRTEQPATTVDGWLSHDTYFDSRAALEVGLVDEITEAPPAPVTEAPAPAESEPGQTEDERLILAMLSAMGDVTVRSKAALARALNAWLVHTVRELG